MGVHYQMLDAFVVAELVEQGGEYSPWDVYRLLYSYAFVVSWSLGTFLQVTILLALIA